MGKGKISPAGQNSYGAVAVLGVPAAITRLAFVGSKIGDFVDAVTGGDDDEKK